MCAPSFHWTGPFDSVVPVSFCRHHWLASVRAVMKTSEHMKATDCLFSLVIVKVYSSRLRRPVSNWALLCKTLRMGTVSEWLRWRMYRSHWDVAKPLPSSIQCPFIYIYLSFLYISTVYSLSLSVFSHGSTLAGRTNVYYTRGWLPISPVNLFGTRCWLTAQPTLRTPQQNLARRKWKAINVSFLRGIKGKR